ncbi:carbohydrate ABC transporter permease [Paenibacillus roseipurpureus]|uniref:Carbohydrate ABC transporter permease n=1 Tax=Paenibacillus roseopurpureus TaxID=2918901 RepID=A0AA96RK40_9BACL|nr:carbohydrate ABC transporter permease [Paenibacillus sp. MBLB1832]WNR46038.1 carbohydrate ABC transporter permease [Paenibacillus sp. MBLB1832]
MFEKTTGFRLFFWIALIAIGLFVFFPLYWMLNTALKPHTETFTLSFVPEHLTFSNFVNVILDKSIMMYLRNSLYVSIVSSFFTMVISAYAGYSFSKYRYRGRTSFMMLILLSKMFPHAILLLTIYTMMKSYGLLDHYLSLILAFVTFSLPVGTWTMKAYFDQLPDAIIESAKIDGASQLTIIHRIIAPLAVPGLVSTAIYGFVWSWNDLLYSLTLVTSPEKRTLAPGLILNYISEFQESWGAMMAASIVVSIPVTLMFIFLQRYFIQGLTSGAVKG